jgi:cytoskeletal protein CcmA (bactofilin family)
LDVGSVVKGDIEHNVISIETGANFNGKVVRMTKQSRKDFVADGYDNENDKSVYNLTDKIVAK